LKLAKAILCFNENNLQVTYSIRNISKKNGNNSKLYVNKFLVFCLPIHHRSLLYENIYQTIPNKLLVP